MESPNKTYYQFTYYDDVDPGDPLQGLPPGTEPFQDTILQGNAFQVGGISQLKSNVVGTKTKYIGCLSMTMWVM